MNYAIDVTHPCDQVDGPTAVLLARQRNYPAIIVEDLTDRATIGLCKYGTALRAPWERGRIEAYQELLDAVAYLLVAEEYDLAEQVCTLALALRHRIG